MNTRDVFGMKIIDKNAKEVAKIAEFEFNVKTYKVNKIYGSFGNPINKKYYEINPNTIISIGDYLLIDTTVEELSKNTLDKIPKAEQNDLKVNEAMGKTVLDAEGNTAGKVSNIDIDFDNFEITNITISKQTSSFGKKDVNVIHKDEIKGMGDYVIVNKVFKGESKDSAEKEDKKEDESNEKVKVNINID